MLPSTAAMVSTTQTNTKLYGITPVAVSRPTVKSKESPGSSANRPHSAKMMNATPQSAYGPKRPIRYSGSIQDGSSIGTCTAASRGVTSGNGTVADCEFPKSRIARRRAEEERQARFSSASEDEVGGDRARSAASGASKLKRARGATPLV